MKTCLCGKSFWPSQAWIHAGCNKVVVNTPDVVVNKSRTKDRHTDKEARRIYLREYMRKKRSAN